MGGGDSFISFKILKDPMLVQKQTVSNMKALICTQVKEVTQLKALKKSRNISFTYTAGKPLNSLNT